MEISDINGKGQVITNLAEAEFCVAIYMYLRLNSEKSNDRIVILTSEAG